MNILEKALEITSNDRNNSYGEPEDNFKRIWSYNEAYLKNKARDFFTSDIMPEVYQWIESLSVEYVARQGLFIKLGRLDFKPHQDSYTDGIGYLRCEAKINGMDEVL
jgi:hypothetical protein